MPNKEFKSDSKDFVLGVYPEAHCVKIVHKDETCHFQVYYCDLQGAYIGFSQQSQAKAWENAWNVITKKMMKKLLS